MRDELSSVAQIARSAMRKGRFEQARAAYGLLIAGGSLNSADHLAYAGCLAKLNKSVAARRHMKAFYRVQPLGLAPENCEPGTPLILVIRGLDQTKPTLGRLPDGSYKPKLRGGHFTLRYLLQDTAPVRQRVTFVPGAQMDVSKLPPHSLMLNTISDADLEGGSLRSLATYLETHPGTCVINDPKAIMQTTRDGNYERLRRLPNVNFPKTVRLSIDQFSAQELCRHLGKLGFEFPVILRKVGTQTGRSTERIDDVQGLTAFFTRNPIGEYYAIQYKQLLWREVYFRKMRLFCIDGEAYPVVCHFDYVWNVHGGNRRTVMKTSTELMEQEKAFLGDWRGYIGQKAAAAVERVFEHTPLDFFGMDFTVDADGGLFVYELNATMRHSFDHAKVFSYKMPYDQATSAAFEAMVRRRSKC